MANLGYAGIFLLSFIGASSVIIPIPYTVILFGVSARFNPVLLAVVAGLGSALGEMVGYGLGYMGRRFVSKKRERRLDAIARMLYHYGPVAIFIFALTPLPDDLLFIPLGLLHYNLWRAFIPCVAGKFLMCLIITHVGAAVSSFVGDVEMVVITLVLFILVLIAMFKIDWEKVLEKHLPKEKRKKKKSG